MITKELVAPHQGERLHDWLLANSRSLLVSGYTIEEAKELLLEATRLSGRTTQDIETEIENALSGASEFLKANPGWIDKPEKAKWKWRDNLDWVGMDDPLIRRDKRLTPNKVKANEELIARIINRSGIHIRELAKGEEFDLETLFCRIGWLNIGACDDIRNPNVKPLSYWLEKHRYRLMQYICPNYFREKGEGKGWKNDYNIGERMYIVIEFDKGSANDQLALINWLDSYLQLIMVVYSGHRSLHGWFACYGLTERRIKTFCNLAKQLGADQTTYVPSQWVRMPEGWNYKEHRRQKVLCFYPDELDAQYNLVRSELL
jgi:hypothetical protein